jgi:hypothetical protein
MMIKIYILIIDLGDYSLNSNSRESKFILIIFIPVVIGFVISLELFFSSGSFLLSIFSLEYRFL